MIQRLDEQTQAPLARILPDSRYRPPDPLEASEPRGGVMTGALDQAVAVLSRRMVASECRRIPNLDANSPRLANWLSLFAAAQSALKYVYFPTPTYMCKTWQYAGNVVSHFSLFVPVCTMSRTTRWGKRGAP